MKPNYPRALELPFYAGLAGICLLLLAFAPLFIPVHLTSIWMDWEFTGWVVPVGNRFADGMTLYTSGGHSPMSPLPFVLTYLVAGGTGHWLLESALNFLFQAGTLVVVYVALARYANAQVAFWGVLAASCEFFMLPKVMLYDSMVQFLVAATAVTVIAAMHRVVEINAVNALSLRTGVRALALSGGLIALTLLTKQSTAAGLVIGCSLLIMLGYQELPMRRRWLLLAQLGLLAAISLVVISVALALGGFISLPGLVVDVFVSGSQPKGGTAVLLANLLGYGAQIGRQVFPWAIVAAILVAAAYWRNADVTENQAANKFVTAALYLFICMAVATFCWLAYLQKSPALLFNRLLASYVWELRGSHSSPLLWAGLFMLLGLFMLGKDLSTSKILRRLAIVFLPAAAFHNLSVPELRWEYDNNPLIIIVLCAVFVCLVRLPARLSFWQPRAGQWWSVGVGLALTVSMASGLAGKLYIAGTATESWPEITHLDNARLRPWAGGMRKLVAKLRALTADENDAILLLPEDPNVQAWFERPRPKLSHTIVFVDQYWDQYVEEDQALLAADPPKVIVIGPRNYLKSFNGVWVEGESKGAPRLMRWVETSLIPLRYDRLDDVEINFRRGTDLMEVYVRRDP